MILVICDFFLCLYNCKGVKVKEHKFVTLINCVLYTSKHDLLIVNSNSILHLLTLDFDLLSKSIAPDSIRNLLYNKELNQVISVAPGVITMWDFRYSNRYICIGSQHQLDGFRGMELNFPVIEETWSTNQKLFFAYDNNIAEFSLKSKLVENILRKCHIRSVTSLCYFNPSKSLVSASSDGSIKVWDSSTKTIKNVFVGHSSSVIKLMPYPQGNNIISVSEDKTMRVWNLDINDEIDSVCVKEHTSYLVTLPNHSIFYSGNTNSFCYWKINTLYAIHSMIGSVVTKIWTYRSITLVERALVITRDETLRFISPLSGKTITLASLKSHTPLQCASYSGLDNKLFTVYEDKSIGMYDTSTNPCQFINEWIYDSKDFTISLVLVYEHIVDFAVDDLTAAEKVIMTKSLQNIHSIRSKQGNRLILFAGRSDGCISVLNWNSGLVEFTVDGHGMKGVLNMCANPVEGQLVTSGRDNVIKIWRVFPYAAESLTLLMSLYCAYTPIHMCILYNCLGVVFQDISMVTYSLVVYDLKTGYRSDHHPNDDHEDEIVALTSCTKLFLFASASVDGNVHIWNAKNKLIKVLHLNERIYSLSFCGERGDLLVGLQDHLYKISYLSYMPLAYKQRMFCISFLPEKEEKVISSQVNLTPSSASFESFWNEKSYNKQVTWIEQEKKSPTKTETIPESAYEKLKACESDLSALTEGRVKPSMKRSVPDRKTIERGFKKFMKMSYNVFTKMAKYKFPVEDVKEEDDDDETSKSEYREFFGPFGFFTRDSVDGNDGYIPNSVVVNIVKPEPIKRKSTKYCPPNFDANQLEAIEKYNKKLKAIKKWWEDLDEYELRRKYFDIFKTKAFRRRKLRVPLEESASTKTDTYTDVPSIKFDPNPTEISLLSEPIEEDELPVINIPETGSVKSILKPPSRPVSPRIPSLSPSAQSSHSFTIYSAGSLRTEGQTLQSDVDLDVDVILPSFVSQFKWAEWFNRFFPETKHAPSPVLGQSQTPVPIFLTEFESKPEATLEGDLVLPEIHEWRMHIFDNIPLVAPSHWTPDTFLLFLIRLLQEPIDYKHKCEIIRAIIVVTAQEPHMVSQDVCLAIVSALEWDRVPTCLRDDEKSFITMSLQALDHLASLSRTTVDFIAMNESIMAEILVQYLDGDYSVRHIFSTLMKKLGLQDVGNVLSEELDKWDTWEVPIDKYRKVKMLTRVLRFLKTAREGLHQHLAFATDLMKSTLTLKVSQSFTPSISREKLQVSEKSDATSLATMTTLKQASFMDALNYLIDIRSKEDEKSMSLRKDTIVIKRTEINSRDIPPALVRIGESHTDCVPRKTFGLDSTFYERHNGFIPGVISGFAPRITCPLKRVYINPFPSSLDVYDERFQEAAILMLKTSQKLFFPNKSYVSLTAPTG